MTSRAASTYAEKPIKNQQSSIKNSAWPVAGGCTAAVAGYRPNNEVRAVSNVLITSDMGRQRAKNEMVWMGLTASMLKSSIRAVPGRICRSTDRYKSL
jgi:hypothetical protein